MKKIFPLLLLVFSLLLIIILKFNIFNNGSEINYLIEEQTIDLGKIKQSDRSIATFTIKNIGDKDIEIVNIATDCHCTVPLWSKQPIKKDDKYELIVEYDNHSTGFFEQTITVYFKSDSNPPPLLIMQGVIIQ